MTQNIGQLDRAIRLIAGSILIAIGFVLLKGIWAGFAIICGAMMILFAQLGHCPPYALLGIDTRKQRSENKDSEETPAIRNFQ